ncbi:MAG TPA: ECF-type sigma factor [Pirellulales bacterium]|jgi:DNA-directed RNA polymerase specialized sigma24 family protein
MSLQNSVSEWLCSLKAGEVAHVANLWDRYREQLVEIASRRLAGKPKAVADEDDVAQAVFFSLCRGALAGRFDNVNDRDELWWLLLAITKQKSVDLIRRNVTAKRGGNRVYAESALADSNAAAGQFSFDQLVSDCPTPETLAILEEQSRRLLGLLPNAELAKIAALRVEGYSVIEIANILSVSKRAIERKLHLIRNAWSQELIHAS